MNELLTAFWACWRVSTTALALPLQSKCLTLSVLNTFAVRNRKKDELKVRKTTSEKKLNDEIKIMKK